MAPLFHEHYGSVSPAILQGFGLDSIEEEDTMDLYNDDGPPGKGEMDTPAVSIDTMSQHDPRPAFEYFPTNPLIFEGFGDSGDDSSEPPPPASRSRSPSRDGGQDAEGAEESEDARVKIVTMEDLEREVETSQAESNPIRALLDLITGKDAVGVQTDEIPQETNLNQGPNEDFPTNECRFRLATYRTNGNVDPSVVTAPPDVAIGIPSDQRECIVCTDVKNLSDFPAGPITKSCNHSPTTCLACVAACIRADMESKLWTEVRCPECRERLEYDDVQRYADPSMKERYETLAFRSALSEAENFMWCTAACGSGQCHEDGVEQPIFICTLCLRRSCFKHNVPWHDNLTCDEYDALLADPENFRSRFEADNEEAERAAEARRQQEEADRLYAQALMAEEEQRGQAAVVTATVPVPDPDPTAPVTQINAQQPPEDGQRQEQEQEEPTGVSLVTATPQGGEDGQRQPETHGPRNLHETEHRSTQSIPPTVPEQKPTAKTPTPPEPTARTAQSASLMGLEALIQEILHPGSIEILVGTPVEALVEEQVAAPAGAQGEVREADGQTETEQKKREQEEGKEREAQETRERDAREREAREREAREREDKERKAKERKNREARRAQRESREREKARQLEELAAQEAREREAREQEAREAKEREAREARKREAEEAREREAREREARDAREAREREAREARELEERAAKMRNEREARERAEREEQKRKADEMRRLALLRKQEEEQSKKTVSLTTKPCPGCGWAIEKVAGCSHMTCTKCRHEFCYECGADHREIMAKDNSAHRETCRFHSRNLKEDEPTARVAAEMESIKA